MQMGTIAFRVAALLFKGDIELSSRTLSAGVKVICRYFS